MPSKYDQNCALCGTEVMKKGAILKDFSSMTFGSKKIICCSECKGKAKAAFNQ